MTNEMMIKLSYQKLYEIFILIFGLSASVDIKPLSGAWVAELLYNGTNGHDKWNDDQTFVSKTLWNLYSYFWT